MLACAQKQYSQEFDSAARDFQRRIARVQYARKVVRGELRDDTKKVIFDLLVENTKLLEEFFGCAKDPNFHEMQLDDIRSERDLIAHVDAKLGRLLDLSADAGLFDSEVLSPLLSRMKYYKDQLEHLISEADMYVSLADGYMANAACYSASEQELQSI